MATATSAATITRNHRRTRPIPQYAALAFLFVASVAYQTAISSEIVRRLDVSVPYFALKDASDEIDVVTPGAAAAGLGRGDRLLTVNGRS